MNKGPLPPVGEELAAHVEHYHLKRGEEPAEAKEHGRAIAELMLSVYAGQKITYPSRPFQAGELKARNKEIRASYNGDNITELAAEHGLSRQRIFQIVKSKTSTT